MLKKNLFHNQIALVTGGASGIGLGLSQLLWLQGASVIMVDRNGEALNLAANSISRSRERIRTATVDVTSEEQINQVILKTFKDFGRLNLLFNNAGVGMAGDMQDFTAQDWKKVIDVNLWGVIYGIHAAYPLMIKQGFGHIINTASGAGLTPKPGMTAYSAIKHAVVGLSTSLRAEACDYGIKVSVVCPGYIATNIMNSTEYRKIDSDQLRAKLEKLPIRPTTPSQCAEVILKGVLSNKAIIPVTALATLDWWIYRLCPEVSIQLNYFRGLQLRKTRSA